MRELVSEELHALGPRRAHERLLVDEDLVRATDAAREARRVAREAGLHVTLGLQTLLEGVAIRIEVERDGRHRQAEITAHHDADRLERFGVIGDPVRGRRRLTGRDRDRNHARRRGAANEQQRQDCGEPPPHAEGACVVRAARSAARDSFVFTSSTAALSGVSTTP